MIQVKHFLHTVKPKVNFYSVTILKNKLHADEIYVGQKYFPCEAFLGKQYKEQ